MYTCQLLSFEPQENIRLTKTLYLHHMEPPIGPCVAQQNLQLHTNTYNPRAFLLFRNVGIMINEKRRYLVYRLANRKHRFIPLHTLRGVRASDAGNRENKVNFGQSLKTLALLHL